MFIITLLQFVSDSLVAQNDHKQRVDNITHLGINKTYIGIGRIDDFPCGEAFGISLEDKSRYFFSAASMFNATLIPGTDDEILFPDDGIGVDKTYRASTRSYSQSFKRINSLKIGVIDGAYGKRWAITARQLKQNYPTNVFDVSLAGEAETAFVYGDLFHEMLISIQHLSKENELLKDRLASIEEKLNLPEDPRVLNGTNKTNQIEITPNPVGKGQIIINYQLIDDVKNAELVITDMNGRTMQLFNLNTTNALQVEEINLSAGAYVYYLVYDEKKTEGRKLIIQ